MIMHSSVNLLKVIELYIKEMNITVCKLQLNTPVKYTISTSQVLENQSRHRCWPWCWDGVLEALCFNGAWEGLKCLGDMGGQDDREMPIGSDSGYFQTCMEIFYYLTTKLSILKQ